MTALTASVAVITYERPEYVARCLDHLAAQTRPPLEVIVVDSSTGQDTELLIRDRFPAVRYARCPAGPGAMATARNIAYGMSRGDIVAFVDDDAFAEPAWLERLVPHFDDPTVGAVGGRQIRGQPGELHQGTDSVGRLLEDGTLTGNFAAETGTTVEVDHLLGANMAFRRSVLDLLGGIRDGYAGTCVREETDLCLRVSHAGYRLLYTPDAVVDHVAAPYVKGRRFDLRYAYWAQKNHLILLIRNFGLTKPIVRRYLSASARDAWLEASERLSLPRSRARSHDAAGALRAAGSALSRTAVIAAASVTGVVTGASAARADRRGR